MPEGRKSFGEGLDYLDTSDLKGKLIVLEGTDGVGRSTQVELLQKWLEVQGYGVIITGWTKSNLMSKSIELVRIRPKLLKAGITAEVECLAVMLRGSDRAGR